MAASGDHLPARGSSQRATIGNSIDGVEIDCKVKLNQMINANDFNVFFLDAAVERWQFSRLTQGGWSSAVDGMQGKP